MQTAPTHFMLWRAGDSVTLTFWQYLLLCLLIQATHGPGLMPSSGPTWYEWDVVCDATMGLRGWLLGIYRAEGFYEDDPARRASVQRFIAWAERGDGYGVAPITQEAA